MDAKNGHTRRVILPPAAADGATIFDHSEVETAREVLLRRRTGADVTDDADDADEAAAGRGEATAGLDEATLGMVDGAPESERHEAFSRGTHTEVHEEAARQRSVGEHAMALLEEKHSDLNVDQREAAAADMAPVFALLDRERVDAQSIDMLVALFAGQQRELDKVRRQGGLEPETPTLADFEATKRVADYLREQVEVSRSALFDMPMSEARTRGPFATLADAEKWVKKEAFLHRVSEQPHVDNPGQSWRVKWERRYVVLGPMLSHVSGPWWAAGNSGILHALSDQQRELSDQTGAEEWEITRFVLCDVPPAIRRWKLRSPLRLQRPDLPFLFSIEMRDDRLNYAEVRKLFGELARLGLLKKSVTSSGQRDKRRRVYDFWLDRREPRESDYLQAVMKPGISKFPVMTDEDIAREWSSNHPDEHLTRTSLLRLVQKSESCAASRLFLGAATACGAEEVVRANRGQRRWSGERRNSDARTDGCSCR